MPEINEQWIKEQMKEAKVKVGVGNALLKFVRVGADLLDPLAGAS